MAKTNITEMNTEQLVAYGRSWLQSNRVKYRKVSGNDIRFVRDTLAYYESNRTLTARQTATLMTTLWTN